MIEIIGKFNNFIKSFLRVSFIADRSLVLIFAMQKRKLSEQQEAIESWLYIFAEMDEIKNYFSSSSSSYYYFIRLNEG